MKTLAIVVALAIGASPALAQKVIVIGGGGGSDTPPAAVVFDAQNSSMPWQLTWPAPGDPDGQSVGPAETYTFYYSTTGAITQANLAQATSVAISSPPLNLLLPGTPGDPQALDLRLVLPHTSGTYWVNVTSSDNTGHTSGVALVSPQILADFDAPTPVTLDAMAPSMEASAVTLTWTQPMGYDGTEICFEYAATDTFVNASETLWMSNTGAHTAILELGNIWWGQTVHFRARTRDAWRNESVDSNATSTSIISPFANYVPKDDAKSAPCAASAAGATGLLAFAALALLRR